MAGSTKSYMMFVQPGGVVFIRLSNLQGIRPVDDLLQRHCL